MLAALLALLAALPTASPIPVETRQIILSVSPGWEVPGGWVRLYERDRPEAPWRIVGKPMEAALGKAGLAWGRGLQADDLPGPAKREGDQKSPAGVFDLRLATGYAARPPAGARLRYRKATPTLQCVEDPRSEHYNQVVDAARVKVDWRAAESLLGDGDEYRLLVLVGQNDAPVEAGAGSCIFIHVAPHRHVPTEGGTALAAKHLERLLLWLDPAARPLLVQLPDSAYHALADDWGLPE